MFLFKFYHYMFLFKCDHIICLCKCDHYIFRFKYFMQLFLRRFSFFAHDPIENK